MTHGVTQDMDFLRQALSVAVEEECFGCAAAMTQP